MLVRLKNANGMAFKVALAALSLFGAHVSAQVGLMKDCDETTGTIYEFSHVDLEETRNITFSEYAGKVKKGDLRILRKDFKIERSILCSEFMHLSNKRIKIKP